MSKSKQKLHLKCQKENVALASVDWSVVLYPEILWVPFPVKARFRVGFPAGKPMRGNRLMFLFHWYFSCFLSSSPPFLSLPLYLYFPFFSKDYIIYVLFCTFFSLTNISYKLVHLIQLHYKNFWYICIFELSCKCNFLMILSFKQKFLG